MYAEQHTSTHMACSYINQCLDMTADLDSGTCVGPTSVLQSGPPVELVPVGGLCEGHSVLEGGERQISLGGLCQAQGRSSPARHLHSSSLCSRADGGVFVA